MSIHMVCGGESQETSHNRITDEIMEWDSKKAQQGRHEDHIILGGTLKERVENQSFTIRTYQQDLKNALLHVKELEGQIAHLKYRLTYHGEAAL
jgi:hypothetical protein